MSEPPWEQQPAPPTQPPAYEQPTYQQPTYHQPAVPLPGPQTMLGDIGISTTHVFLPSGVFPIAGTQWTMTDSTYAVQKTSTVGVVLAVVLFPFLCFFSLFFLMMKEQAVQGAVQVHVAGTGFSHSTMVYAAGPGTAGQVTATVNWARTVAHQSR